MLNSINFSQLLSNDLHDLAKITLQLYDRYPVSKSNLDIFLEELRESLKSFENTFQRRMVSCLMERKTMQASRRDEAYIAFYSFVEASCHRPSEKNRQLGEKLLSILQQHEWGTRDDGYHRQATCLPALIKELNQHHQKIIQKLGATEWFNDLIWAQAEFDLLSDEKKIGAFKDISVRETRPILENALRTLFCATHRLYQSVPTEDTAQIIHNITSVIGKLLNKPTREVCIEAFYSMESS